MINDVIQKSDFPTGNNVDEDTLKKVQMGSYKAIAQLISAAENFIHESKISELFQKVEHLAIHSKTPIIGITGPGGSGKSTLVDEIVRRFLIDFPDKKVGILSVDPTKRKTGGALLGDRIRMNSINHSNVYMRSMATR